MLCLSLMLLLDDPVALQLIRGERGPQLPQGGPEIALVHCDLFTPACCCAALFSLYTSPIVCKQLPERQRQVSLEVPTMLGSGMGLTQRSLKSEELVSPLQ